MLDQAATIHSRAFLKSWLKEFSPLEAMQHAQVAVEGLDKAARAIHGYGLAVAQYACVDPEDAQHVDLLACPPKVKTGPNKGRYAVGVPRLLPDGDEHLINTLDPSSLTIHEPAVVLGVGSHGEVKAGVLVKRHGVRHVRHEVRCCQMGVRRVPEGCQMDVRWVSNAGAQHLSISALGTCAHY